MYNLQLPLLQEGFPDYSSYANSFFLLRKPTLEAPATSLALVTVLDYYLSPLVYQSCLLS